MKGLQRLVCALAICGFPSTLALAQAQLDRAPAPAAMQAGSLRCEYHVDPLAIDSIAPRLSWIDASAARAQTQSAYRVLVASTAENLVAENGDLWDSGKVATNETNQIAYAGKPLASRQECFWKVQVWDQNGKASAWSAPARWTMGLLAPSDWQARWIEPAAGSEPVDPNLSRANWIWVADTGTSATLPGAYIFRRVFEIPEGKKSVKATACFTGSGGAQLYINGQEQPANPHANRAEPRDATALLHPGKNVLALMVNKRGAAPGTGGLIGQLTIDFDSGDPLIVATDAGWKAHGGAPANWAQADFDDAAWGGTSILGANGIKPFDRIGTSDYYLPPARAFRREFAIDKPVKKATLYATALGLYEMHINGQRVGNDVFTPGWEDYDKRVYYNAYDVTALLKPGANAAGALLADGWWAGFNGWGAHRDFYGREPKLRAQLEIEFNDGTRQTIATDGEWRFANSATLQADMLMGEMHDARLEQAGWDAPGFKADASWKAPAIGDAGAILVEAYSGDPVRAIEEIHPKSMNEPKPGVYVFNMDAYSAGVIRLKVAGAKAGDKIEIQYGERLNADGTVYTENLRDARATDYYICRGGGEETWTPRFTFHGYQYVQLEGYPGKPDLTTATALFLSNDSPRAGRFDSSDSYANRLFKNILATQWANMIEAPTDCPQRDERQGWTGDAQVYIRTATYNNDVAAFFDKWIVSLMDGQSASGAFPTTAPKKIDQRENWPGWSDAGVICPWTIFEVYNDKRIIGKYFDQMAAWVELCRQNSADGVRPAVGIGDHLSPLGNGGTPLDVVATAYFGYSAKLLADSAEALGRKEDAAKYNALFNQIKAGFAREFIQPDGTVKGNTQASYVFALRFGLVPDELRAKAVDKLVEAIKARDWHLTTGFLGTKDIMETLTDNGRADIAWRLFEQDTYPSWRFEIENGAVSMWERWDGWTPEKGFQATSMNSFAHYSFGAVGQWMYNAIGGIDTDGPGYRKILIRPVPGGHMTWAKVGYDSISGPIESSWKIEGGRFKLDVAIPANTTATVILPTADAAALEGGKPLAGSKDATVQGNKYGGLAVAIGSGSYAFDVAYAPMQPADSKP